MMVSMASRLAAGKVRRMPEALCTTLAVPPVNTSLPVIWRPSANGGRVSVSPGQVRTWTKMAFSLATLPPQSAAAKGPARPPPRVAAYCASHGPVTGETLAARTVTLTNAGFDLDIPDDGFVWLARHNAESGSDFLDRMAPSLPDVSMEVAYLAGMDGETAFAAFDVEKRDVAPLNLPDDWDAGPQLVLGDGQLELTASYETLGGVVIVGIFQEAGDLDVAALAPMLEAIADAALISELGVLDK